MNLLIYLRPAASHLRPLGAALLTLLFAGAAFAFPRPTIYGQIATTHIEGTVIFWDEILLEHDRLTLNVTAPCGDFSQVFKQGEAPFFDVAKLTGEIDGSYTYELVATPTIDPSVQGQLAEVRGTPEEQSVVQSLWDKGLLPRGPFRQAGFFEVERGLILPQDSQEEGGAKSISSGTGLEARRTDGVGATGDASLADSLRNVSGAQTIAQSLCVGFDCPTSPSFDDTTILMMENNTRIKFDDTSTISGFPNRDWELEANSRSSGGGSYFAINDCGTSSQGGCATDPLIIVEAGAPGNSLRIDNGGRVGMGTSNPVVELHVVDGDTPTLRLEQDTSSGFAQQTWDVAGNETSFFVRDATNGSTLPFRIRPGADSNSLVIDNDNDIGIGVLSPAEKLHLTDTDNPKVLIEDTSDNANDKPGFILRSPAAASNGDWLFEVDNTGNFQIDFGPSTGPEILVSDSTVGNSTVTINGDLMVNGTCTGCDAVFDSDFELESLEEHAALMWQHSYLPAVGPTPEGQGLLNVFAKTTGILQELEKAHIYIEQLHNNLQEKSDQMESMARALEELRAQNAALAGRMDALTPQR